MTKREKIRQCHAEGLSIRKAAKRLDLPTSTVSRYWPKTHARPEPVDASQKITTDFSKDSGTITVVTPVRTLDDALHKADVDESIWEVDRWVCNAWEQHSAEDGTVPLWQIKVWLKRRHAHACAIEHVLEKLPTRSKPLREVRLPKPKGCLLNLSIPDLHVGKRPIAGVYPVERVYEHCISSILARTANLPIELIHLPIGSDLLNVDTSHETTTRGTPQRQSESFEQAASRAVNLLIATIDRLKSTAPVRVTAVRGNHDRDSTYWVANILAHHYRNDAKVQVDHPGPGKRVYLRFGSTLILTYHGDCVKPDQLESLMIRERPEDFAQAQYREAHAGHLHKSQKKRLFAQDTLGSVVFRQLPSLSPTDQWHHDNGYVGSPRYAEAQVYHPTEGPIVTVEARPPAELYSP